MQKHLLDSFLPLLADVVFFLLPGFSSSESAKKSQKHSKWLAHYTYCVAKMATIVV